MAGGGMQQQGQGGNVYNTSANAYNGAVANASSPQAFGQRTQANMNPYIQNVTDRTMNDMERQRQMAINDTGAAAQAAGAFGGSRHGVAESLTNEAYGRAFGDVAANLNMNGYNNAQNLSMQQGQQLGQLAGQGFGMGNSITQQQLQQGTLMQGMNQSLIDAARGQWQGFAGAPGQSLQYPLAAISGVPSGQTTTTEQNPGLLNYLSLGASLLGACWVAREVYGPTNPRWMLFREWLLNDGPVWFRNLYIKHGEKFAGVVKRNPWMKPIIRRFMDSRIK